MNSQIPSLTQKSEVSPFYRFRLFHGEKNAEGKVEKSKFVGMAYLKEGQTTYTLRLWMLLGERFYLVPNREDSSRYFVMTREPHRNPVKNKYFWNIVGNARVHSAEGVMQIDFDLLHRPVFMSLFPEQSSPSVALPDFASFEEAA